MIGIVTRVTKHLRFQIDVIIGDNERESGHYIQSRKQDRPIIPEHTFWCTFSIQSASNMLSPPTDLIC